MASLRREAIRLVWIAALASAIVLIAAAMVSLVLPFPPYSPSQRIGFLLAGSCFGALAAGLWAASRRLYKFESPSATGRVMNIVLVGYLLGVLLPGIRFFTGEQSLGWAVASGAAVIVVSAAVALLSTRRDEHRSR
jgi:hypothetical protein